MTMNHESHQLLKTNLPIIVTAVMLRVQVPEGTVGKCVKERQVKLYFTRVVKNAIN